MANLTQPYEAYEKPGLVVSYRLSNVKVFKGAMLALNSNGFVVPLSHATGSLKFIGIANETVDNSAGAAGDRSVNVTKSGAFVLRAFTGFVPAITDLGKEVFANTDWEVQAATAGLTNQYKVGTIVALETTSTGGTGIRVRIGAHTV